MNFSSKPSHVTPQIDCLIKTNPVLRVSIHISGVSNEIDGKTFIFQLNLVLWPLKLIILEKQALSWGFQTHIYGVSKEIDGENINISSKPRHVTGQIDHLRKTNPVLMVTTHTSGISKKIDGKMFIFQVNLGMWPLKLIILEKQALFWGFQHTFMMFPRR